MILLFILLLTIKSVHGENGDNHKRLNPGIVINDTSFRDWLYYDLKPIDKNITIGSLVQPADTGSKNNARFEIKITQKIEKARCTPPGLERMLFVLP